MNKIKILNYNLALLIFTVCALDKDCYAVGQNIECETGNTCYGVSDNMNCGTGAQCYGIYSNMTCGTGANCINYGGQTPNCNTGASCERKDPPGRPGAPCKWINGNVNCECPIPKGSYLATCTNVSVKNCVLSANCKKYNKEYKIASLDLLRYTCKGDIKNTDGNLKCKY